MALEGFAFSLLGILAGWLLNEMSKRFQISRERKGHIGRALSNLLELHHQIRAVENTIQHLMLHFGLPDDAEHYLRPLLQQMIPQDDECVAQFSNAIEQLSESDPLTAFVLRNKGQIPHILATLRSMVTVHGVSDKEMEFIQKQLREILIPTLETAIRELAQLHGASTKRKANAYLDAPFQILEEAKTMLQNIEAESQKQLSKQETEKSS